MMDINSRLVITILGSRYLNFVNIFPRTPVKRRQKSVRVSKKVKTVQSRPIFCNGMFKKVSNKRREKSKFHKEEEWQTMMLLNCISWPANIYRLTELTCFTYML